MFNLMNRPFCRFCQWNWTRISPN